MCVCVCVCVCATKLRRLSDDESSLVTTVGPCGMYCRLSSAVLVQAMFDASELITQREVVSQRVNELLQDRAESFHLLLDDISLVRMYNAPSFAHYSHISSV